MDKDWQSVVEIASPDISITHIASLPLNHTQMGTWCLHTLFANQAQQTPNQIAVVCQNQPLTYAELNQRANQVSHYLVIMVQESKA